MAGNRGRKNKTALLTTVFLVFILGIYVALCYRVTPVKESFKLELGESVSDNIRDYLEGASWSLKLCEIDASRVDTGRLGEYEIIVSHGFSKNYIFPVSVVDSKGPEIRFKERTFIIEKDKIYEIEEFVESASDNSGSFDILYSSDDSALSISRDMTLVSGGERGDFKLKYSAVDGSGNITAGYIILMVDTPPEIFGVRDFYTVVGTDVPLLDEISCEDLADGNLTSKVECHVSDEYLSEVGDYCVTYSCTDSNGFIGTREAMLYVMEPIALQEMVNRHELSAFDTNVFGVLSPFDMGTCDSGDINELTNYLNPCLVHLQYDSPNGGYIKGSGFIISIDSEKVVICTNHHVVGDRNQMDVYFHNGYKAAGNVVATAKTPDIAFMCVPVKRLPEGFVSSIRSVHMNLPYFNDIPNESNLGLVMRVNYENGAERATRTGKIIRKTGVLSEYYAGYDYPVTEVSVVLESGFSGAPIVDEYGNLICMATFLWNNYTGTEYYGVKLADIEALYMNTFGKNPDYYEN